jgi:drug/metabolite transporter (DMT)-like permease
MRIAARNIRLEFGGRKGMLSRSGARETTEAPVVNPMGAAFLATVLFALSVVFASRTTRALGGVRANLYRLVVAAFLLGLWAHLIGAGLSGGGFGWFFLSGCIGFGLGDLALYLSLPRVGPRLAGLLVQCLAPPFAAVAEWLWMDTVPTGRQLLAGIVILTGVAVAVAPRGRLTAGNRAVMWGVAYGVVAAMGQGLGAVVSRKAYLAVELAGGHVDGLSAAYQRILGGLLVGLPASLLLLARRGLRLDPGTTGRAKQTPVGLAKRGGRLDPGSAPKTDRLGSGLPIWVWVLLNALAGPAVGVGCYQWALATTPSAVVLPIVATMPILLIPLAWWMEGDRPSRRSVIGGVIAVGGAVGMAV